MTQLCLFWVLSDKVKGIAPYWQAPVSSHHGTPQVTTGSNTCVSCLSGVRGVVGCTQAAPTGSSASHNNQNHHKMAKPVLMRSQRFAMTVMHGPSCLQFKVTEQLLPVQYYSTTFVATGGLSRVARMLPLPPASGTAGQPTAALRYLQAAYSSTSDCCRKSTRQTTLLVETE